MRSRDAASSTRSIALSGRNREVMYRLDSVAAATSAASEICTLWCASYFSLRPRRIPIVSSTLGSPTSTCWNRRSRAGSFSMCWRYSSSVVAPTIRSSPRASIGLSMLPASIADSPDAPAPTTVCSSSMNVTTWPSESLISSSTAFSRSSNSPRYFAPASIAPRSSATSRLPRNDSGTSPATIRWASPSTTAVLPTPGSPMRTGLFFVRRDSTWTTRRISASRPMTGSMPPARARAVRSMPYFSRAWNEPSGSADETRAEPRTWSSAAVSSFSVAPTWPEQLGRLGTRRREPEQQVLGGQVRVAARLGALGGNGEDALERTGGLGSRDRRAGGARQPRDSRLCIAAERGAIDAYRLEEGEGDALGLVEQRDEQVRRLEGRVAARHRPALCGGDGFLALGGEVHSLSRGCRVILSPITFRPK